MRYIRVETLDLDTERTLGGYVCAAHTLLALLLNIAPSTDAEELTQRINESDNPEVTELLSVMLALGDIPCPDIYMNDKENHVCLYQMGEFEDCFDDLEYISCMLYDASNGRKILVWKEFVDLSENEILYEDMYQIVISKDAYDKHNKEVDYLLILPLDLK